MRRAQAFTQLRRAANFDNRFSGSQQGKRLIENRGENRLTPLQMRAANAGAPSRLDVVMHPANAKANAAMRSTAKSPLASWIEKT